MLSLKINYKPNTKCSLISVLTVTHSELASERTMDSSIPIISKITMTLFKKYFKSIFFKVCYG